MKNVLQNQGVVAAVTTILSLACIIWIGSVHRINGGLEKKLKEERLKSEAYLSEKLSLDKEIAKMKIEFKNLIAQNTELDKAIFDANKKINQKEAEVIQLRKESRSLKDIQKRHDELKQNRQDLDQQLLAARAALTNLKQDNADLSNRIALLESRNKNLVDELSQVKLAAIDDIRIEAVKKKSQQLTATAKKTKKMIVTFEVPASLQSSLSYKITGPSGNQLTDKNGSISSLTIPDELILTAGLTSETILKKKQIQMVYETKEKLQGGIYTVEVSSDGLYIGSLQVRLR